MKKIIYLFLIVIIIITAFTGCKQSDDRISTNSDLPSDTSTNIDLPSGTSTQKTNSQNDNSKPSINNDNKLSINDELKDVYAFFCANKSIIAAKKDGRHIKIHDFIDEYKNDFAITDNKIYINSFKGKFWGYIDLTKGNGNYELTKFTKLDYNFDALVTFTAIDDKIYYETFMSEDIFVYDTKNNIHKPILSRNGSNRSSMLFHDREKRLFYYSGIDNDIYMYDIKTKQQTKICHSGTMEFVYNDILICTLDDQRIRTYYEYNIKTSDFGQITSGRAWGGDARGSSIVPYGDGYILSDEEKLYKIDSNGNKKDIHSFNENAGLVIDLIAPNKIISITEGMDDTSCVIFDLDKKTVKSGDYTLFGYVQYVNFE